MKNSHHEYYHDLVTQKSWEELISLRQLLNFVLIGGWAVYLYTHALKSKDINIIIDYDQLPVIGKSYQLFKNERLRKYEAIKEEVQIDIYLPHMAQIGIPIEEIIKRANSVEGFKVVDINLLFILKLVTLNERGRSPKGRKDMLDILSIFISRKCDLSVIEKNIADFSLSNALSNFRKMLNESVKAEELGINPHRFSKIKKELLQIGAVKK